MRVPMVNQLLVLVMLLCPFVCTGLTPLTSVWGDPCCPSEQHKSDDRSPDSPSRDDGSCGGCLCDGASTVDSRAAFEVTQTLAFALWAPAGHQAWDARPIVSQLDDDSVCLMLPGIPMRALLQSFLL